MSSDLAPGREGTSFQLRSDLRRSRLDICYELMEAVWAKG